MERLTCSICGTPTAPILASFSAHVTMKVVGTDGQWATRVVEGTAQAQTTEARPHRYGIIACQACGQHFVAQRANGGQWEGVYPISHKAVAKEILEPMRGELEEAQLCFAVGAYRGCASMCETALEALWQEQGASRLNDLRDKGIISQRLFEQATEVRLWANMAKHELISQPVSRDDAEELLTYLEDIMDNVYVKPKRRAALKEKREQLEKGGETSRNR